MVVGEVKRDLLWWVQRIPVGQTDVSIVRAETRLPGLALPELAGIPLLGSREGGYGTV